MGLAIPGLSSDGDRERGSAGTAIVAPRLGRTHTDRLLAELAVLEPDSVDPVPFPDAAARSGAVAVIDASPEGGPGPPHALRFGAAEAERYLAETDVVRRTLALFDPPAASPAEVPRWRTAVRALIRAAGGSA